MSRTTITIDAPPERVWEVLADPACYGHWVVGSKFIRDADAGWPAVGTRFHHAVGVGPLTIKDHTEALESEAPRHLKLRAKARPAGIAHVTMDLEPRPGGRTCVVMREAPASPLARLAHNPLMDLALHGRNVESLRRLKGLAEGGHGDADRTPAGVRAAADR